MSMIINPEDSFGLWFYPRLNRFRDEDGHIIHDLSEFFSVWQLENWKKQQKDAVLVDKQGYAWELYWLDEETEAHILDHAWLCWDDPELLEAWLNSMERDQEHERMRIQ